MSASAGNTVEIHYTGKLVDGEVFDSSRQDGREPLEFVLDSGAVIPGFDAAVTGMSVGDTKTVTIPVDQAYGPRRDELLIAANRSELPADFEPNIGDTLMMQGGEDDPPVPVIITAMDDTTVSLDANHRLAGKDLVFELELVAIQD
jgi:FKBP-type peptidyl-prolyl cis-trans isomerase 2